MVGVCVGLNVFVGVGVGVTTSPQSTITALDNELVVHGESNLIVILFGPKVLYVLNALKQSTPEQTPSTPIGEVVPSPQSTVNIISPTLAILFKLVVLITVTLLQSIS